MSQDVNPPANLLGRIMRRFGLERQMVHIRRIFSTSVVVFLLAFAGTLVALMVLRAALRYSAFLPYIALLRSDFSFIIHHWGSFMSALFESAPAAFIALVLFGAALLLACLRLIVVYWHRLVHISSSIRNN